MDGNQQTALIALASAASWGAGDFSGGMGVKAAGSGLPAAIRFLVLAHAASLAVLVACVLALHETLTWSHPVLWAIAGGITGALGLVAFYKALSRGAMGVSAAVSGLLAALIPAIVSSLTEGFPAHLRLFGFALAAAAIWLIAAGGAPEHTGESVSTLALAIFAGIAFGFYFVTLKFANPLGLLLPMAIARASSLALCLPVLAVLALRSPQTPSKPKWLAGWRWALAVALLDTGGNILFVAATRTGRLDIASVLASLYPAGTILIAAWWLREHPTPRQVCGMVTALAAAALITA